MYLSCNNFSEEMSTSSNPIFWVAPKWYKSILEGKNLAKKHKFFEYSIPELFAPEFLFPSLNNLIKLALVKV